jgi:hypothetical protein
LEARCLAPERIDVVVGTQARKLSPWTTESALELLSGLDRAEPIRVTDLRDAHAEPGGEVRAAPCLREAGLGQSRSPAAVRNVGLGFTVPNEVELHAILPLFLSGVVRNPEISWDSIRAEAKLFVIIVTPLPLAFH